MKFTIRSKVHGLVTVQVDPQDAHFLRHYVWSIHVNQTGHTYLQRNRLGKNIALHQITAAEDSEIVRFRNGDQLDMRRANLLKEPKALAHAHLTHHALTMASLKISDQLLAAREVLWDGLGSEDDVEMFICDALAVVNDNTPTPFFCHGSLPAVKFLESLGMPLDGAGFHTPGSRPTSSKRTQARRFDWLNIAALHAKELGL